MRPLAGALVLIIVALAGATYFFVSGVTREVRSMSGTIAQLADAAVGEDDPLSTDSTPHRFQIDPGEDRTIEGHVVRVHPHQVGAAQVRAPQDRPGQDSFGKIGALQGDTG